MKSSNFSSLLLYLLCDLFLHSYCWGKKFRYFCYITQTYFRTWKFEGVPQIDPRRREKYKKESKWSESKQIRRYIKVFFSTVFRKIWFLPFQVSLFLSTITLGFFTCICKRMPCTLLNSVRKKEVQKSG